MNDMPAHWYDVMARFSHDSDVIGDASEKSLHAAKGAVLAAQLNAVVAEANADVARLDTWTCDYSEAIAAINAEIEAWKEELND